MRVAHRVIPQKDVHALFKFFYKLFILSWGIALTTL